MRKTKLKNGLTVVVEESHVSRVACAQVWVRVGSADETEEEAGLAHVHEHMLFKGTERRAVGQIAQDVEAAGGDINAWTSFDQTVYHVTIASREIDVALDILADAVQHSAFDPDELGRELEVVLEELRRNNDNPAREASRLMFETAFTTHPYRRPVIGYVDTVKSFTRERILDFYHRWYQPQNMCLVVAGDVDADAVVRKAEALFESRLNEKDFVHPSRPEEPMPAGLRVKFAHQAIQESHLSLAWPGTSLHDDDTPAIDLLSVILGSGESARLQRRLRRELGLVNDSYAYAYTPQDRGLFVAGAQVHGEKVAEAMEALATEVFRATHTPPSAAELEKAKTIILAESVYQRETVQGLARKLGYFEVVAGGADFEERYYEQIRKTTAEEVQAIAQRYLLPERLTVTALMPEALQATFKESDVAALIERGHQAAKASQAVGSAQKPLDISTPSLDDAPSVHFSPGMLGVVRHTLQNGATLLISETHDNPLVSVRAASVGGLLAEDESTNGVSHLVGELLCRGTERYSEAEISEAVDAMASGLSGQAGRNSLGLRGEFLAEHFDRGFELFASCLLEPAFAPEELEKERKIALEDIASREDSLSNVAFEKFASMLYGTHPYARPTLGTETSVRNLTREQVVAAFRQQLRPDRLTLSVVGDVDPARIIQMVEARIGSAQPHADARAFSPPTAPDFPTAPQSGVVSKAKEQAHLVVGFPGLSLFDDRRFALEILATALAGQSGRLFLELRDRQSLAYAVTAFGMEGVQPGYFAGYIGTSPDKLEAAESGFRAEFERILADGITEDELRRAKRYVIGAHEIGLQRGSARAATMALNEAYGLGYAHYADFADRIDAVTGPMVVDVARDVIRFDRMVRAVVGPVK